MTDITNEELSQWAEKRADDAGRLARELIEARARIKKLEADKAVLLMGIRLGRFEHESRVRKHGGSWWEGRVVGVYSTAQTPIGYCVQLDTVENGPVQIYPEAALEKASD